MANRTSKRVLAAYRAWLAGDADVYGLAKKHKCAASSIYRAIKHGITK